GLDADAIVTILGHDTGDGEMLHASPAGVLPAIGWIALNNLDEVWLDEAILRTARNLVGEARKDLHQGLRWAQSQEPELIHMFLRRRRLGDNGPRGDLFRRLQAAF